MTIRINDLELIITEKPDGYCRVDFFEYARTDHSETKYPICSEDWRSVSDVLDEYH